jgi:hypothetical protein
MKQVSLYLIINQFESLKKWNEKTGSSYSSLIRNLLTDFFSTGG